MLYRVNGRSMEPTLHDGDVLLARRARTARPGSLVVVRWLGERPVSVKRLVSRDGDGWWVERDNASEGTDSWAVGAVPPDGLLAVVVARLWPRPRRFRPGDLRTPGQRGG
jgi:signal peptidase I